MKDTADRDSAKETCALVCSISLYSRTATWLKVGEPRKDTGFPKQSALRSLIKH